MRYNSFIMDKMKFYNNYHHIIKIQKKIVNLDNFTYRNTFKILEKYIPKYGNVLDIGSATGTISFYLASQNLNVDGIEISKKAVKYANLNKKIFNMSNVKFYNLPFDKYESNKKYELVTCFEVLEHLENDFDVLNKIKSFMTKKSYFVLSVPSINAPLYKLGLLKRFDKEVGHLRRYSMEGLCKTLSKVGFKVVKKYKTEGLLRSLLFTNIFFGILIKLTRIKFFNDLFTYIDKLSLKVFPESQLIVVCKKI